MKVTRDSKQGDVVTVTHPKTGEPVEGMVRWVSPTGHTVMVALNPGFAYVYPEKEWGSGEMSEHAKRWYAQNGKSGFKGAVKRAHEEVGS